MATYHVKHTTKNKIKKAAFELFWEEGYDNVTCAQIAEKADVKLGTLTYHFPKKEVLFKAYVLYMSERLLDYCVEMIPEKREDSVTEKLYILSICTGVVVYNEVMSKNFLQAMVDGTQYFYEFLDHMGKEYWREYLPESVSDREAVLILTGWNGIYCGIIRMLNQNAAEFSFAEIAEYLFKTEYGSMLHMDEKIVNYLYETCLCTIEERKPLFNGDFSNVGNERQWFPEDAE